MNARPTPNPTFVALLAALVAEHGPNALNELVAAQLLLDAEQAANEDDEPLTDASWDEFGPDVVTDWTADLTDQLLQQLCGWVDCEHLREAGLA